MLADPVRPGFWLVRFRLAARKWGPATPACIVWLHTRNEPTEPSNAMERSPFLAAFVAGLPASVWDIQASAHTTGRISRVERRISRAEYEAQMTEITAARRVNRYLPAAVPFQAVAVEHLPIPFARKATR